ncbi:hypothetical protein GTY88_40155, partial [Streptomyces sp. SID5926]|nr:hypothetical protein [Streptomyces sp. SID5926]
MRSFRDRDRDRAGDRVGDRDPALRARRWAGGLALALVLPLAGCATDAGDGADSGRPGASSTAPAPSATAAPEVRAQLRVDGDIREYLLHRPPAPAAEGDDGPRPLLGAFHGRGADAAELRAKTRLERTATARGMLVAFPEGLGHGWGAGTRATKQRPDPGLDVRFTEALIEHLVRTERADPGQV